MIEVRIRYASEATAQHLCEWDAAKLDQLIPMLGRWRVADAEDKPLSGQLQVEDTGAYFEVLIHDDEAE